MLSQRQSRTVLADPAEENTRDARGHATEAGVGISPLGRKLVFSALLSLQAARKLRDILPPGLNLPPYPISRPTK